MLIGPVRYYSALLEIPTVAPLPRNDINRQLVDRIYTGAYRKINDHLYPHHRIGLTTQWLWTTAGVTGTKLPAAARR